MSDSTAVTLSSPSTVLSPSSSVPVAPATIVATFITTAAMDTTIPIFANTTATTMAATTTTLTRALAIATVTSPVTFIPAMSVMATAAATLPGTTTTTVVITSPNTARSFDLQEKFSSFRRVCDLLDRYDSLDSSSNNSGNHNDTIIEIERSPTAVSTASNAITLPAMTTDSTVPYIVSSQSPVFRFAAQGRSLSMPIAQHQAQQSDSQQLSEHNSPCPSVVSMSDVTLSSQSSTSTVSFLCLSQSPPSSLGHYADYSYSFGGGSAAFDPSQYTGQVSSIGSIGGGDGVVATRMANVGTAGFQELHPFRQLSQPPQSQQQQQPYQQQSREQLRRGNVRKSVRFNSAKLRSSALDAKRKLPSNKGHAANANTKSDSVSDPKQPSATSKLAEAVTTALNNGNTSKNSTNSATADNNYVGGFVNTLDPEFIREYYRRNPDSVPPPAAKSYATAGTRTATATTATTSPKSITPSKPPQICVRFNATTQQSVRSRVQSVQSSALYLGPSTSVAAAAVAARATAKAPPAVSNVDALVSKLSDLVPPITDYSIKLGGGNDIIRLLPKNMATYRQIIHVLELDNSLTFNTYQLRSERSLRVVVRGIHASTSTQRVRDELTELGYTVRSVYVPKYRDRNGTGRTFSPNLFFIDLGPNTNTTSSQSTSRIPGVAATTAAAATATNSRDNRSIFKLKSLCRFVVSVEWPKRRYPPNLPQCHRCQEFNHTARYCRHAPRCVKCGSGHLTTACLKPPTVPAKCANCQQDHTANFQGCPHYASLLKLALRPNRSQSRGAVNTRIFRNSRSQQVRSARPPQSQRQQQQPNMTTPARSNQPRQQSQRLQRQQQQQPKLQPQPQQSQHQSKLPQRQQQRQQQQPLLPAKQLSNNQLRRQTRTDQRRDRPQQQQQQLHVINTTNNGQQQRQPKQQQKQQHRQQQQSFVKAAPLSVVSATAATPSKPTKSSSTQRSVRMNPRERFAHVEKLELERQGRLRQQFDGTPTRDQIVEMQQCRLEQTFQGNFNKFVANKKQQQTQPQSITVDDAPGLTLPLPTHPQLPCPQPMAIDHVVDPAVDSIVGTDSGNNNSSNINSNNNTRAMLVNQFMMQQKEMSQLLAQFEQMKQTMDGMLRFSNDSTASNSPP